jgi:cellulose synthase/poly-beta-1,6-N-acetylglucosamine synthase-like glycosyltransferase
MSMKLSRGLMWGSAGLIAWTQVGYPLAAAALARRRRYAPRRDEGFTPDVALIIAAHNEEGAIEAQLENVLRLDYPEDRLEVLVALDGSADGTRSAVERVANERVRVLDLPRAGKVSAQNAGVRSTSAEVLAFSDAHSPWEPASLRQLVRNFADPEVGYVCGKVELDGETDEHLYWSFETWLREHESACGSLTAGSGAIYAVRRSAFVELGPEHSHDIALPFRLRRNGFRLVFEPAAVAREPGRSSSAHEWPRKVRMLSRAWSEVLHGGLLDPRGQPPSYVVALLSHRLLRYATGPLHVLLFAATLARAGRDRDARLLLSLQLVSGALAVAGWRQARFPLARAAWYYAVVNAASIAGLFRTLTRGPDVTWSPLERER